MDFADTRDKSPLLGETARKGFWSDYSLSAMTRKQPIDRVSVEGHGGHGGGSINETSDTEGGQKLKRNLTLWDLITYGLASTLGSGILVTVGQVANATTGPSVMISFLLAGFASFLSALCYSEFAARIPVSGSAYSFAYIALGELTAWFVGWNLTLEYAISASAVASGWGGYVNAAFNSVGVELPHWLYPGISLNSFFQVQPLSALICILCTLVLLIGMKESARFNLVMTVVNCSIIVFFIIAGAMHVKSHNWHPFFPYGMAGTWAGVGQVFFSYIGFDSVSTLAGEVARPARDLPLGIVGTLLIVTAFYVIVSLVLSGMVPYTMINQSAPLAVAFHQVGVEWASILIAFGSVTTISATCLASLVGQPRIFYQMAQDGLMFPIFGKLHPKTGVPVYGTILTGIISAVIALFLSLSDLLDMISIGTLLAFTVVCGGVIILRYGPAPGENRSNRKPSIMVLIYFACCVIFSSRQKIDMGHLPMWANVLTYIAMAIPMFISGLSFLTLKQTNMPATFKCPLVPLVPCLGILMNTWFILSLGLFSIVRLIVWTAIGMAIYFGYGIRNSALRVKTD